MSKLRNISDEYRLWLSDVCQRFKSSQIKAGVSVNSVLLEFYWNLGKDIVEMDLEKKYGTGTMASISADLQRALPGVKGLSQINVYYTKRYYLLYCQLFEKFPQVVEKFGKEQVMLTLFSIPWGHHRYLRDKFSGNPQRAFYYVLKTHANGWSRAVLLNMIDLDAQQPVGKAITNFQLTLPTIESDLAKEITRDPYTFDFTAITESYKETELKKALEVKVTPFRPEDVGQLGTYVSAVNHILKGENDNPTIGLLVCKNKNNVLAQYALESSNVSIGISEYELSKLLPENFKSALPSIEDIENEIKDK